MKQTLFILGLILLSGGCLIARADETITVSSTNVNIAENLDLKAVATLFGEVANLEEFEKELNSDERHLSNLDLNGDGIVDYLRVVEITENNNHLIIIQAVLAKDIYQDVASIYVEKQNSEVSVQIVGDEYIYGKNYIVEPVFIYRPIIYDWFWGPSWVCWHSPYYWGCYPGCYHYYSPWPCPYYHNHIVVVCQEHPCSYCYNVSPRSGIGGLRAEAGSQQLSRSDLATAQPENSFAAHAQRRGIAAENYYQAAQIPTRSSYSSTFTPASASSYDNPMRASRASSSSPSSLERTSSSPASVERTTSSSTSLERTMSSPASLERTTSSARGTNLSRSNTYGSTNLRSQRSSSSTVSSPSSSMSTTSSSSSSQFVRGNTYSSHPTSSQYSSSSSSSPYSSSSSSSSRTAVTSRSSSSSFVPVTSSSAMRSARTSSSSSPIRTESRSYGTSMSGTMHGSPSRSSVSAGAMHSSAGSHAVRPAR